MKKVLCFGDSNTFGYIPADGKRYDKNTRWTGILQNLAGNDFKITEAGCNNRTGFVDNPDGEMMTGYRVLPRLLEDDFNIVILAVGINDLQVFYNISMPDIKRGLEKLIDIVYSKLPETKILVLAPSVLNGYVLRGNFSFQFNETSIAKSCQIGEIYETVCKLKGCEFLNLDDVAKVSNTDGLHYEASEHAKIARAVFDKVLSL